MRKHLFSLFLFFALACVCTDVYASNEVYAIWDGTVSAPTQDGTKYIIRSASELAWLAAQQDAFAGVTFELAVNVDLDGRRWLPIGSTTPFAGVLEGKGHLIRGLRSLEGTDGVGLFGHVAQAGVIRQLGISGGTVVAMPKRRVGALAGVCDGAISECWSMAEIAAAGQVVGGLVGELGAHGTMTDCYCTGLILNAQDTIGGLVGMNKGGLLTRAYHAGYAKNGNAIVGVDERGRYEECYYDRKLYYQTAGAVNGITPLDETEKMYPVFDGVAAWRTNSTDRRYPTLRAFDNTDAALLSSATLFIEKEKTQPVNHANGLLDDFELNTNGGVAWACQDKSDEEWIQIEGSLAHVIHPCSETDVLLNSTLGSETRVVYMRPIKLRDFERGSFRGKEPLKGFCYDEETYMNEHVVSDSARYGWSYGMYHYMVTLDQIDARGDTVRIDTLLKDAAGWEAYNTWLGEYKMDTKTPGTFVVRRWVHDERCVQEWICSYQKNEGKELGKFVYTVYPEFQPGKIESGQDTIILMGSPVQINVSNLVEANGGGGPITYTWEVNRSPIANVNDKDLKNYTLTAAGEYTFRRMAQDSANCVPEDKHYSEGTRVFVLFDRFDPGELTGEKELSFCSVEEAKNHVVEASTARGGNGKYHYAWEMNGTRLTVSGATEQELPLTNVPLEAGKDYVFSRRAEDETRFTNIEADSCVSAHTQKIHIMATLQPGAIKDGTLTKECVSYDADPSTTITVKIEETETAKGDKDIEYRWVRMPDGAIVGDKENLNYTFPISEIIPNTTYTYTREVRNPQCEWQASAGQATQYYGQSTYAEAVINVCDNDLPFTMEWHSADGVRKTYTFNKASDTWLVRDENFDCPADTLFSLNVIEVPELKIEEHASLCQTEGTITLYFEQTAGLSDIFHITYSSDLARYMHAEDTTGIITAPGTIVLRNVPSIGTGDLFLFVQIGYTDGTGEGQCFSTKHRMDMYISLGGYVYSKYDRVLFVDNNPDNGLLATSDKLKFVSYQWYKNGIEQEGQTGQYYHENGELLSGVYYVMLTDTEGRKYRSCDVEMPAETNAAAQMSAVYPVPVGSGEPLTIEGVGAAQILSSSGECVMRMDIEGATTVSAPRATGMYYVQVTTETGDQQIYKLIVK